MEIASTQPMLLVTPRPHKREAFLGYLLRVSEDNGYPAPTYILSVAGLNEEERRRCHLPIERVTPVLNRLPSELAYNVWAPSSLTGHNSATLRGHEFLARSLCLQHPKICPACIEEKGFIKSSWDVAFMVGCCEHDRALVYRCAECDRRLTWQRQGLLTCACGGDLTAAPSEPLTPPLRELLGYIECKFYGEDTKPLYPMRTLPLYELEPLPLQSLVTLIEIFGKCALGNTGRNRNNGSSVDPEWYLRVATEGAKVLTNWPNNFYRFLDRLYLSRRPSGSAVEDFDLILFKNSSRPEDYTFVRLAAGHWRNMKRYYGEYTNDDDSDARTPDNRFMSLRQYAAFTGVDVRAIRKAIRAGILKVKQIKLASTWRYLIDLKDMPPEIVKNSDRTLNTREAAQMLGLSEESVRTLMKRNVLTRRYMPVPAHCFRIEDVQRFKKELLAHCPLIQQSDVDRNSQVKLPEILHRLRVRGVHMSDVIEKIQSGSLVPIGRTGDAIQEIVLAKAEVFDQADWTNLVGQRRRTR